MKALGQSTVMALSGGTMVLALALASGGCSDDTSGTPRDSRATQHDSGGTARTGGAGDAAPEVDAARDAGVHAASGDMAKSCADQVTLLSAYTGDGVAFKAAGCLFGRVIEVELAADAVVCARDYSVTIVGGVPDFSTAELADAVIESEFMLGSDQIKLDIQFAEYDLTDKPADTEVKYPDDGTLESTMLVNDTLPEIQAEALAPSRLLLKKFEGKASDTELPQEGVFAGFVDAHFPNGDRLTASFHAECDPGGIKQ